MLALAKRYHRVFLTYHDRPAFVSLIGCSFGIWAAWLGWKIYELHEPRRFFTSFTEMVYSVDPVFFLLPFVATFAFVALLMSHVRQQLVDPRADLMPNFRAPHLVIASIAFLLAPAVYVGVTLTTEWALGLTSRGSAPENDAIGLFAVALTMLVPAAWWASWRSPWVSLLTMPLVLLAIIWTPAGNFFGDLIKRQTYYYSDYDKPLTLIIIDLALLGLLLRRLIYLKPDSPKAPFDAKGLFTTDFPPVEFKRHDPILGALSRVWHRRRGVLDPRAPWAVAGLLSLLLVGFSAIHGVSSTDLLRSAMLPALVPGVVISLIWRERLSNLQHESLYPASHGVFIGEMLAATAVSLVELWVTTTLAVIVPILIWHKQFPDVVSFLAVEIVASAAMQFLAFGVLLVASLSRGILLYSNIVTIIALALPMSMTWDKDARLSPHGLLSVALCEMAVGIALTLLGTLAWRRTDLA
jgi:hypothetical protein